MLCIFSHATEEDSDGIETTGGDEGFVEVESSKETYTEPSEYAKHFVGNSAYDIDIDKLAIMIAKLELLRLLRYTISSL